MCDFTSLCGVMLVFALILWYQSMKIHQPKDLATWATSHFGCSQSRCCMATTMSIMEFQVCWILFWIEHSLLGFQFCLWDISHTSCWRAKCLDHGKAKSNSCLGVQQTQKHNFRLAWYDISVALREHACCGPSCSRGKWLSKEVVIAPNVLITACLLHMFPHDSSVLHSPVSVCALDQSLNQQTIPNSMKSEKHDQHKNDPNGTQFQRRIGMENRFWGKANEFWRRGWGIGHDQERLLL